MGIVFSRPEKQYYEESKCGYVIGIYKVEGCDVFMAFPPQSKKPISIRSSIKQSRKDCEMHKTENPPLTRE